MFLNGGYNEKHRTLCLQAYQSDQGIVFEAYVDTAQQISNLLDYQKQTYITKAKTVGPQHHYGQDVNLISMGILMGRPDEYLTVTL
ncbi:3204_t:CDS:2 [Paraglomus brasilianum]|uniref:3204_t:CDS:1 n=1 Tax=Paraglomus brasilianum TaxID=144538 RepID=A0A9N9DY47_9GLOM|nr:3204_t:CDS:2 [Paraglomus brasilianum]